MIYLDNAATSMPKAPLVAEAMADAVRTMGNASRGAHSAAMRASDTVYEVRSEAAKMFAAPSEENVIFTLNATHAINIAVNDLVSRSKRIVVSPYEHNAVMRALRLHGADVAVAECVHWDDESIVSGYQRAIENGADGAVCCMVSNVFGNKLPYERIAEICRSRKVPLLFDASQAAGTYDMQIGTLGVDYVALPGHKGLYGPQGTGILLTLSTPRPLMAGGTGSNSRSFDMPDFLPDRLEAGTLNLPGIAGLGKGLEFVRNLGPNRILRHESALISRAAEGLRRMGGVTVFWPEDRMHESGVLSFSAARMSATDLGEKLAEAGIAVRSGLHCAPLAHLTAGTIKSGTVRISVSAMNADSDIDALLCTLKSILKVVK